MSDEANNPESELALEADSPAPEAAEAEDTQTVEEVSDTEAETLEAEATDETEGEPAAPEFVSVEYDGQEYEVPSTIKDALLRQSDYTKKMQDVSVQRKARRGTAGRLRTTGGIPTRDDTGCRRG